MKIYCGIKRPRLIFQMSRDTRAKCAEVFNRNGEEFETLGTKILKSLKNGANLGSPSLVAYDEAKTSGVDVTSSPNHDFFDVAEEFGQQIEKTAPPIQGDDQSE